MFEKEYLRQNRKWLFCIGCLCAALLLLGGTRLTDELKHSNRLGEKTEQCRLAASAFAGAVPETDRHAFLKIMSDSPEFAVRINCVELGPVAE